MIARHWTKTASIVILVLGCFAAQAQEGADCPVKQKLTLDQVVGFIERKVPEQRTLSLIESCHVSFSLNAAALDRLTAAGVSGDELQALNRETLALLTVDQAHVEVAGLERYITDSNKSIAAERDAALQKLNAEFQVQRAKAAHIEPRGEFETTQEFNTRKQQAEAAVAALDRKHEEDASRVTLQYQANANAKAQPFQARIAYLQNAEYPEAAEASYTEGTYNPDTQSLPVTIGGDGYLFNNVPPVTAKQIIINWKGVAVARPYTEDEMSSRWLRLNGTQIAIEGESRKKLEEKIKAMVDEALVEARGRETQNDFKGALDSYQRALGLDSTNWTARNGAESMRQKLATLEEAKRQELEAERKRREELYNRGESLYEQKRFRDSMPLFQKACDSGDMAGCARLGQLYDYGNGVPKDHARAIPLYQKACDAGVMSGCGELSGNYSLGTGVNPDYIKARALAQRACNSGNALGCNNLAWLYLNGRGVTRDLAQARFFYQKACNGGFDLACASLRTVH